MAINPLVPIEAIPVPQHLTPVTEANAVRAVIGRIAALARPATNPDPPASGKASAEAAAAAVVTQTVAAAAPRQGGLSPLLANLSRALDAPDLPAPVRAAAQAVLALRTPLTPELDGHDLKAAAGRSGLFLEARLGARPAAANTPLAPDLKAALLVARQVLSAWAAAAPAAEAEPEVPPPPVPVSQTPGSPLAPPPATRAAMPPPPPFRDGPVSAQPAAQPSLALAEASQAAARVLLREADAAVARQELLQAASLPPAPGLEAPAPAERGQWRFEVPFATPQGTAVAQFEITRDGGGGAAAGEGPAATWRARFAIDAEPFGPVQAAVSLNGVRAGVRLWAERPETAARLQARQSMLAFAFEAAEYSPEVAVMVGTPPPAAGPAGRFVDRSS